MPRVWHLAVCALLPLVAGCAQEDLRYASFIDNGHRLPPVPISNLSDEFHRHVIDYKSDRQPGTIIVDTNAKFLYLVMPNRKAMRYGIAVGAEAFSWKGTARVAEMKKWPTWTPPPDMIKREPELAQYAGGVEPSIANPLGARALYLYNGKGDTGFRIHGTPEWTSIGRAKSSGCIRLINQDIIDLYDRVERDATVIVL